MNKRIRELWEQANIRHTNDYALSNIPREEWPSIPEVFSELIVRECVTRIKGCHLAEYTTQDEFELGYKKAIDKAISQVLLHLGIDE